MPESEEDRLDHVAGIGGVKDLEATWSTPLPSTSQRVHPVSFSTLYIVYIVYAMYMFYVSYILYILHHAIYFTCYLINVILLHFTANPVSQTENRMDPTEVGRLNKSNSPQSDESIGGSAVVMEQRREELLVSLDTSSVKRKERDERNESSDIAEDSTEDKDDSCNEPSSKTRKVIMDDNTFKTEVLKKLSSKYCNHFLTIDKLRILLINVLAIVS